MKTLQEFEQYLDADRELAGDLEVIDKQRKSYKGVAIFSFILVAVIICGVYFYAFTRKESVTAEEAIASQSNMTYYAIFGFLGLYALSFVYYMYMKRMKGAGAALSSGVSSNGFEFDFKDKVVRRIISFWDPSFRYQINNHIKRTEILESGMLYPRNYTVSGSDMIRGEVNGVSFRFSDIHISIEKTMVGKNENPYETVMAGSFFIAEFNKRFINTVYVYPSKFMGINSVSATQHEGDEVKLEDPEFARRFKVYSTDQVESRYILTPVMMERLKALCDKMGNNVYFVFANRSIYIANNNGKDRFEASWYKSLNKKESLVEYFNELAEQLNIIEELKLNPKIWKPETIEA